MQGDGGEKLTSRETKPSSVPLAQQGGEIRARWAWVEPVVWTDRMLKALEEGVEGGVWFRLIDKVWSLGNLSSSYRKVKSNEGAPGVDHVTVEEFGNHWEANVGKLIASLRDGSYEPQAIRRVYIPKPGSREYRPLGIPTVRDRVVQGAVRHILEPIFEKEFAVQSYGFRPGMGCKDALRRLDELLKSGYVYVLDADLKSYFDSIPHDRLLVRLRERIADGRMLGLIESFLKAGIMEGLQEWEPETGVPQGAVLSPLLSNVYLNPLDHQMAAEGFEMIRYADDFVIVCRSESEAEQALSRVRQWCEAEGLQLHPDKTRIVDVRTTSFEFLGYEFATTKKGLLTRWARKKSVDKLKDSIRVKTKRRNGRSLESLVKEINGTLKGWFVYFKHSHYTTFPRLDRWIRMRLRSILRGYQGRKGRGRGRDHQRWPNSYFTDLGLYNLVRAHELACQSPRG
jgi:RNA-directed DNA polymerase